jgi:hypothetical protein
MMKKDIKGIIYKFFNINRLFGMNFMKTMNSIK